MAKNGNGRKITMAIITLALIVAGTIAAIVKGYTKIEVEAQSHTTAIETVKIEGCLPARQGKTDIQLIKKDVEVIKDTQEKMDGKLDELLRRP